MVGLAYNFDPTNSPFCAGTLISSEWVLTTASCSYSDRLRTSADKVKVVLGEVPGSTAQVNQLTVLCSSVHAIK